MRTYLIMPEHCTFLNINATSPEMAYGAVCNLYSARNRVAVMDTITNETRVYTRRLDSDGNLIEIIEG